MDKYKRLLNHSEKRTHKILREIINNYDANVFVKVRVADVLDIDAINISNDDRRYALQAHFDFVIVDQEDIPQFVVEFDGPTHHTDPLVRARDQKKNRLCKETQLPILRIDADYLRQQTERFSLLSWFIELWFSYKGFCIAQTSGSLPPDADFSYFGLVSMEKDGIITRYDIFGEVHNYLVKCRNDGMCKGPAIYTLFGDLTGYDRSVAILQIEAEKVIVGEAKCRSSNFLPQIGLPLCEELAYSDAAKKFREYLNGNYKPRSLEWIDKHIDNLYDLELKSNRDLRSGGSGTGYTYGKKFREDKFPFLNKI